MSFVPSPMQEEVIRHRGGSLLVSAAAGSGKTTTLIAHVLSRLCEKEPEKRGDLRRMIIVTYTNAAASEMRARLIRELRAALENDPENAWLRLQSEIALGETGVFLYDGNIYVRQYRQKNQSSVLHALNDQYTDIIVSSAVPLKILAKVL